MLGYLGPPPPGAPKGPPKDPPPSPPLHPMGPTKFGTRALLRSLAGHMMFIWSCTLAFGL